MRYLYFRAAVAGRRWLSRRARSGRMKKFIDEMQIQGGERIIDLGGAPRFWDSCPHPLDITIVNLPGFNAPEPPPSHHTITLIEGDACDVDFAADMSFDIAVSNSVIEHVGGPENEARLAVELRRLAPRYWVQTPSIWFPIEAHTYVPFYWFYPAWLKRRLMARWRRILPERSKMIAGTTVLSAATMRALFPDGQFWTEWVAGFPKSYVLYRTTPPSS